MDLQLLFGFLFVCYVSCTDGLLNQGTDSSHGIPVSLNSDQEIAILKNEFASLLSQVTTLHRDISTLTSKQQAMEIELAKEKQLKASLENEVRQLRESYTNSNKTLDRLSLDIMGLESMIIGYKNGSNLQDTLKQERQTIMFEVQQMMNQKVQNDQNISNVMLQLKDIQAKMGSSAMSVSSIASETLTIHEKQENLTSTLSLLEKNVNLLRDSSNKTERDLRFNMTEIIGQQQVVSRKISQLQIETSKRVYFSSGILQEIRSPSDWNSDQVIRFDKVISNIGGGYSPSTGVFTTPVNGVYVFSCFILTDKTTLYVFLEVNGSKKFNVLGYTQSDSNDLEGAGNLIVLDLQQGDRVLIKKVGGNNVRTNNEASSTTFSGFLLY